MITGETSLDKPADLGNDVVVLQKPTNTTTLYEMLDLFCQKDT